jgi:hypothetical protein
MEPFTLIVCMMGGRFEETRVENLGRGECVELKLTIEGDRGRQTKGQCIGAGGYILPGDRPTPICANCGLLPGRKQV